MPHITIKISLQYRIFLFLALALSWMTGITFFVLNRWFAVEGIFGWENHPWQYPALQVHGIAAFTMLMCAGALIANHLPSTWKTQRLRTSGLFILGALCLQIGTAYLLYYASNDDFRSFVSNLHTLIGATLPLILTVHILRGIRNKRSPKQSKK